MPMYLLSSVKEDFYALPTLVEHIPRGALYEVELCFHGILDFARLPLLSVQITHDELHTDGFRVVFTSEWLGEPFELTLESYYTPNTSGKVRLSFDVLQTVRSEVVRHYQSTKEGSL